MKIIVGINNITDSTSIHSLIKAGVDEFYLGYVPQEWSNRYGWEVSPNRRQFYGCNYTDIEELRAVVEIVHGYGKKVMIAFNEHEYSFAQMELLLKIIKDLKQIPFDAYIISNLALMLQIRAIGDDIPIRVSIGAGCNNIDSILFYTENVENIEKVILPRKLTIREIEGIATEANKKNIKLEVFGYKDPCYWNDEYCYTWHAFGIPTLCGSVLNKTKENQSILSGKEWKKEFQEDSLLDRYIEKNNHLIAKINHEKSICICERDKKIAENFNTKEQAGFIKLNKTFYKCGLCAIQKFKDFGIDTLKIPLRGTFTQDNDVLYGIKLAKKIIDEKNATPEYCQKLINSEQYCDGVNCYYNYPYEKSKN